MKFSKLTKKLLLSALSLGLAVVTLTTTTYAWYTTSTEASATGAEGSTSGTTSDSTLLVSTDYDPLGAEDNGTWTKTVKITDTVDTMVPIVWQGNESFVDAKNTSSTNYYSFTLYFKTTKTFVADEDVKVYLKNLQINNSEEGDKLTTYDNLLAKEDGKGTLDADTYAVDVVRALDMVISDGTTKTGYELSDQFTYATAKEAGLKVGSNAQTYYDGVMGDGSFDAMPKNNSLTAVKVAKTGTVGEITKDSEYVEVGVINAGATKYEILAVTFYFYLNGEDVYCFDACKDQTFEISLEFTTVAKTA